jgi:hypothetical protein
VAICNKKINEQDKKSHQTADAKTVDIKSRVAVFYFQPSFGHG